MRETQGVHASRDLEIGPGDSLYGATYDSVPINWDGELDTYLGWAREAAHDDAPRVLELACGTGRLAIPMAEAGCEVWGVDLSPTFLKIARSKRDGVNPRWVEGDMRTVELGVEVDFALIAAQSFGFMLTADDQLAALTTMRRHLRPHGRLAIHVELMDYGYLQGLPSELPAPDEVERSATLTAVDGVEWRVGTATSLDRLAEALTIRLEWARMDGEEVAERRNEAPMGFKVLGVVEMEHALRRAGCRIVERREWQGTTSTPNGRQLVWLAERED